MILAVLRREAEFISHRSNLSCQDSENILNNVMSQPEDLRQLSLFPLNVVLFPGMPMPLHIFEERYKAMIGECVDREEPFGIILIKEGLEVGEPAEPVKIGTTARIAQVERLEEGRLNIMTKGEKRFEVVEITQQVPHVVALVRYLTEQPGVQTESVLAEAKEAYGGYMRNLTALTGGWTAQAEVPDDPVILSFAVASSLASGIEIPRDVKQDLLESPDAAQRLEKLLPILKRGNEMLAAEVTKRNPFRGSRLN